MIRFYFMPLSEINTMGFVMRIPKYIDFQELNHTGIKANYNSMDYGKIPVCFVTIDITDEDHNLLINNKDLAEFPTDLDSKSVINDSALSALENMNIPTNWIKPEMTNREVLGKILMLFQIAQRHHGLHNESLQGQLTFEKRNRVQNTIESMGYKMTFGDMSQLIMDSPNSIKVGFGINI